MITLHGIKIKPRLPEITDQYKRMYMAARRLYGNQSVRFRVSPRRKTVTLEYLRQEWWQQRPRWRSLNVGFWDISQRDSVAAFNRLTDDQIIVYEGYAEK